MRLQSVTNPNRPELVTRRAGKWRAGVAKAARGFSLIEMVVAMALGVVLLAAMGSALVIAARAMPSKGDAMLVALTGADATNMLASDLQFAISFSTLESNEIEFTVPDRTGDGVADVIRYAWSEVVGAPLTREINGGKETEVVPSVSSFALAFNTKTVITPTTTTKTVTSPEVLLSQYDGWLLGLGLLVSSVNNSVDRTNWISQFFTINEVNLPADTRSVSITRVRLYGRRLTSNGTFTVGIFPATGGVSQPQPQDLAIGAPAEVALSALPSSNNWFDVTLPANVIVSPSTLQYCVVAYGSVAGAAQVQMYSSGLAPTDSSVAMWSTDGGNTWRPSSSLRENDHRFRVYGTYTTVNTTLENVASHYLQSVQVNLRSSGRGSQSIATAVEVYAQPQVTLP